MINGKQNQIQRQEPRNPWIEGEGVRAETYSRGRKEVQPEGDTDCLQCTQTAWACPIKVYIERTCKNDRNLLPAIG